MSSSEHEPATAWSPPPFAQIPSSGLLLAVGLPLGIMVPATDSDEETTGWVRADGRGWPLLPSAYEAWLLAMKPQTDDDLSGLIQAFDITDPEYKVDELVSGLEAAGLLLRVLPRTDGRTLANVRVIPLAIGAGNSTRQPDVFEITNVDANTTVGLDGVSYAIWSHLDGTATIGTASRAAAQELGSVVADENEVFARVPQMLVALMGARYVFIDAPIDQDAFV